MAFDERKFCEGQVEYYAKQIEWSNRRIEWCNSMIQMEREDNRRIAEYVWNKGVLTKTEMQIWGNPKKPYKGKEWKEYERQRSREYRHRKEYEQQVKKYEARLAAM